MITPFESFEFSAFYFAKEEYGDDGLSREAKGPSLESLESLESLKSLNRLRAGPLHPKYSPVMLLSRF